MRRLLGLGKFFTFLIRSGYFANDLCSVLCSDLAVKQIDEPFVLSSDDRNEWVL